MMTIGERHFSGRLRRRLTSSEGAQLVEFGMVLPILVFLALGVWDFGDSFALKSRLTNAAREGARIVVSTPLTNFNCGSSTPCPIVAAATWGQAPRLLSGQAAADSLSGRPGDRVSS